MIDIEIKRSSSHNLHGCTIQCKFIISGKIHYFFIGNSKNFNKKYKKYWNFQKNSKIFNFSFILSKYLKFLIY